MADETRTQPDTEAGFCTQWGPEKLAEIDREWADGRPPTEPAPPIANVALALELSSGLDADREYRLHEITYLFRPTPYGTALRIWAWSQELGRMEGLAKLLDPGALLEWDRLPELRRCYAEILKLAGSVLVDQVLVESVVTQATSEDVHDLVLFMLYTGDEVPIEEDRSAEGSVTGGVVRRYDAAHYLFAYLERFGSIPGMVILERGRPAPASWRHFQRAVAYLRRSEAEKALVASATGMGADEKTRALLVREAGQA